MEGTKLLRKHWRFLINFDFGLLISTGLDLRLRVFFKSKFVLQNVMTCAKQLRNGWTQTFKKTSQVFHEFWFRTFDFYWIKYAAVCIFQIQVYPSECDLLKKEYPKRISPRDMFNNFKIHSQVRSSRGVGIRGNSAKCPNLKSWELERK